jgi:adenine-specific DNA methylase
MASLPNIEYVSTRYLGSKRRLSRWIVGQVRGPRFHTVLDAFGGTASVSYAFKQLGKQVTYNDFLASNYQTGLALIQNPSYKLTESDVSWVLTKHKEIEYPSFIKQTFGDMYYTDRENAWLDMAVTNIAHIRNRYKRALAYHVLFQSCLVKRPFNLFHRRNLYLRLANVRRTFYNHVTWARPFCSLFRQFSREANSRVFDNGKINLALNCDVFEIPTAHYDLIYIDSPYVSPNGNRFDYYSCYHFLEGLCDYDHWASRIDYDTLNKRLLPDGHRCWGIHFENITHDFDRLFCKFQDSILVVSYMSPGIPSVRSLKMLLEQYKRRVKVVSKSHKYVLSTKQRSSEVLFIAS